MIIFLLSIFAFIALKKDISFRYGKKAINPFAVLKSWKLGSVEGNVGNLAKIAKSREKFLLLISSLNRPSLFVAHFKKRCFSTEICNRDQRQKQQKYFLVF